MPEMPTYLRKLESLTAGIMTKNPRRPGSPRPPRLMGKPCCESIAGAEYPTETRVARCMSGQMPHHPPYAAAPAGKIRFRTIVRKKFTISTASEEYTIARVVPLPTPTAPCVTFKPS